MPSTLSTALTAFSLLLAATGSSFVKTHGADFTLDGAPFRFAGANNYYLLYQDPAMVEDVFARAAAHNFTVLRTWGFLDVGRPDGSESVGGGPKNGVWLQALDGATNAIVYNESGFKRMDFVLATAARYNVKLILTLSNNWQDFGGMDQYVRWEALANASYAAEGPKHDDFYERPWQRAAYAAYVSHVAARVNSITGTAYKDDPTIFAWELANEPRCQGSGAYASSNNCTLHYAKYDVQPVAWKITPWVAFASQALKAADPNHLVAVCVPKRAPSSHPPPSPPAPPPFHLSPHSHIAPTLPAGGAQGRRGLPLRNLPGGP
jgi:mannan endo-1,4-beta-mannosidase